MAIPQSMIEFSAIITKLIEDDRFADMDKDLLKEALVEITTAAEENFLFGWKPTATQRMVCQLFISAIEATQHEVTLGTKCYAIEEPEA